MSEVDILRKMAVSITGDSTISLGLKEQSEDASATLHEIVISDRMIPLNLRHIPEVVSKLREGQVIHESGHYLLTRVIDARVNRWARRKWNHKLAKYITTIVEDVRVNHYLLDRYRFDFAKRLARLIDVMGESLQYSLERIPIKKPSKTPDQIRGAVIINLLALKSIYGLESPTLESLLRWFEREALAKATEVIKRTRYMHVAPLIMEAMDEVYDTLLDYCMFSDEQFIPTFIGGKMGLTSPRIRVSFEDAAERQVKREGRPEEATVDREGSVSAGGGSGFMIPAPNPNPARYQHLVQRNLPHIQRLLSVLKRNVKPKSSIIKWSKRGRLMMEVVPKAVGASNIREVDRIYKSRETQIERERVAVLLITDLSGSMNIWEAENFLTTVSEAMGRWLRNEDFATLVFGSNSQKIKTFVEPYHTTRYRIGGVTSMAGTVLSIALKEAHKMFNSLKDDRRKVCVVVSDFHVDKPDECAREIKEMKRDKIDTIGIGICTARESEVKAFTPNVVMCSNVSVLADKFVDVYRNIALG